MSRVAGTFPVLAQRAASEWWKGAARPFFLLAEAARSECPPSMHAVKNNLAAPFRAKWEGEIVRDSMPSQVTRLAIQITCLDAHP
jgi:hypothetical protein